MGQVSRAASTEMGKGSRIGSKALALSSGWSKGASGACAGGARRACERQGAWSALPARVTAGFSLKRPLPQTHWLLFSLGQELKLAKCSPSLWGEGESAEDTAKSKRTRVGWVLKAGLPRVGAHQADVCLGHCQLPWRRRGDSPGNEPVALRLTWGPRCDAQIFYLVLLSGVSWVPAPLTWPWVLR